MSDEDRLAALEARVQRLEDELEITRLIASYGPLVDAGRADEVASLWTDDGVFDVDGLLLPDREAIAAMVRSADHQGLVAQGCTHLLSPVSVRIDGDDAVAVCHSVLLVHHEGRFHPVRSGANRWSLRRTPQGWRATYRTSRTLDGAAEATALLAD